MSEKLSILALLSQGRARPLVFGLEEEGTQPRRGGRRLRGGDGETFVVELEDRFKPTGEMDDIRKEIERSRLQVARAYERLIAKRDQPTTRNLAKLLELVSEAEFLANQYRDLELAAREAHKAKREEISRAIARHEDRQASGLKVPFEEFRADQKKARENGNGHQSPDWLEQFNRIELARLAARWAARCAKLADPVEELADALAEGEISLDEHWALKRRFALPIKPYKEPVFRVRRPAAQPKDDGKKKKKKRKGADQGGRK